VLVGGTIAVQCPRLTYLYPPFEGFFPKMVLLDAVFPFSVFVGCGLFVSPSRKLMVSHGQSPSLLALNSPYLGKDFMQPRTSQVVLNAVLLF